MHRAVRIVCVLVGWLACALPAIAQPGGGFGARLSDDEAKAAWTAEARAVASLLGIEGDKTDALVSVYTKARAAHAVELQALFAEMRNGGGGMAQMREKFVELNEKHKARLDEALKSALSAEQRERALKTLGAFNRLWDMMAHAVIGFGLDDANAVKAQKALARFFAEASDAEGPAGIDEARTTLESALAQSGLSESQVAEVVRFTRPRRGMGGGRGGGGE